MSIESVKTWNMGIKIALETYKLCACLPKSETYGLADQMKRAGVSISSNIAEGYGRESTKEYIKFLSYAKGSVLELRTQIQIGIEVGFFSRESTAPLIQLCTEELKMLSAQVIALYKK